MRLLAPAERAVGRLAGAQDVPGASTATLDPEEQVCLQLDRLVGAAHPCVLAICGERPLAHNAAVVECGLTHEFDLHPAVDAGGRAHERVVGVLVGGRTRVGCDRVFRTAWSHRERVTHDHPARGCLPRSDEQVRPRLVDPSTRNVDPEWPEAKAARAAVEYRSEYARR